MLPDKWWFDTSQDWEVLGDNFDSVSSDVILEDTLQALDFHLSSLGYLEKGTSRFVDVMDKPELAIEPGPEDNGQPITDYEAEKARKVLECAAKKKVRCENLRALIQAPAAGSAAPSSRSG